MFAMCESLPTMVLMSWFASPGTNDRTTHNRSARAASFGNVLPKVTPGIAVLISPVGQRQPAERERPDAKEVATTEPGRIADVQHVFSKSKVVRSKVVKSKTGRARGFR